MPIFHLLCLEVEGFYAFKPAVTQTRLYLSYSKVVQYLYVIFKQFGIFAKCTGQLTSPKQGRS